MSMENPEALAQITCLALGEAHIIRVLLLAINSNQFSGRL